MQADWIPCAPQRLCLGDFTLESGAVLEDFELSYVVHRSDVAARKPPVLVLCAIGSSHHRLDFLIGPGRALDPVQRCIVVVDAIGNGLTTSPSTAERQHGFTFPRFTIRDMVHSQKALMDVLGFPVIDVVGASMGGMQALQWAVSYPLAVSRVAAMTPTARTTAWSAAMNHAMRSALQAALRPGQPTAVQAEALESWCALMHLLCTQTPAQVDAALGPASALPDWLKKRSQWLVEQGFDAIDWIYQSHAYDAHDVGTTPGFGGDTAAALASISAEVLISAPATDLYNPVHAAEWARQHIAGCRWDALPGEGHIAATAADPLTAAHLNVVLADFLA